MAPIRTAVLDKRELPLTPPLLDPDVDRAATTITDCHYGRSQTKVCAMTTGAQTFDPLSEAMRSVLPIDSTGALRRLQTLVQTQPNLRSILDDYSFPPETLIWLGQLDAIVDAMKRIADSTALRIATNQLVKTQGQSGAGEIRALLYRVLAAAELAAPASEQGAFIAAGNEFDGYAVITKVLASAQQNLLVIDPYMDGKALTDFLSGASELVSLRVLTDEAFAKPTLAPAVERWRSQFGQTRPLEVRLAPARSLHDRLIIVDEREAWSLTQSLKNFAERAHASVLKADAETAGLKISAYILIWTNSRTI